MGHGRGVNLIGVMPRMREVARQLPNYFRSPFQIVYGHTLGALYLRFMTSEARSEALESALGPRRPRWMHPYKWMSKAFETQHPLRFCQECAEADRRAYGCCYWHLSHQLPLVRWCTAHHQPLQESAHKQAGWVLPGATGRRIQGDPPGFERDYAAVIQALCGPHAVNSYEARPNISRLLEEVGVITASNAIKKGSVQSLVAKHMPDDFNVRAMPLVNAHGGDWVGNFLQTYTNQHPARWAILLTCLLREGVALERLRDAINGELQPDLPGIGPGRLRAPYAAYESLGKGISLVDCALELSVHKNTVERWLFDPRLRQTWNEARFLKMREAHRVAATSIRDSIARSTSGTLQMLRPDSYQWLCKHDSAWLHTQFQIRKFSKQLSLPLPKPKGVYRAAAFAYELILRGLTLEEAAKKIHRPVSSSLAWLSDPQFRDLYESPALSAIRRHSNKQVESAQRNVRSRTR